MNDKILVKTPEEIELMIEGGKILAMVKNELRKAIKIGENAESIENLATELILKYGAKPSFNMVPKYFWSTCVNINEGIVHGIPVKGIVFKKGDVVSVDVGVFYKGFHTDTSFSVGLEVDSDLKKFLSAGENALKNAISKAKAGGRIYDISEAIENSLVPLGYNPVKALVGHGVGRDLHEGPQIPGVRFGKREDSSIIPIGAALAIEVIYTMGNGDIKLGDDGWTISTKDDKISALYEDTIVVTEKGTFTITEL